MILDYEQNISSLTEEVEQLRSEMHKISTMRKELNDLDTQRQKEHDDQENILRKLNQKLDKSEENNKVLSQKWIILQQDFDLYKEAKEDEIAGLKIDKNILHTEYEDYKSHYNEYYSSMGNLKKCLDQLKSDYKLLSLENETLQKLLERNKRKILFVNHLGNLNIDDNARGGRKYQSYERLNSFDREPRTAKQIARGGINPYESLNSDKDPIQESGSSNGIHNQYFSVRRGKPITPYTPSRTGAYHRTKSPEDVYQLRKREIKHHEEVNLDSQSPILNSSVHRSVNKNGYSINSLCIQNPF